MKINTWLISTLIISLIFVASLVLALPISGNTIEISATQTTMVSTVCTMPNCNGILDTGKVDNNDCPIYECPTITTCPLGCTCTGNIVTCPTTSIGKACTACVNGTPTGQVDQDNCPIYNCPTIACTICVGGINTGKFDANGCEIYDCPASPACTACIGGIPTGEVDNNGCPIYNCPPTKACTACVGGVPTGKIDEDGCPIYVCPAITCPAECVCDNGMVTCLTKENKPIEVAIVTPAGVINVTIEKVSQSTLAIKQGSSVAKTTKKIIVDENKLLLETSTGNKEIKFMPNAASEMALNKLKLMDFEIELKDVGKPVYEIEGTKDVKILGFISAKMSINSQVDADSGLILRTNKPWWSFLAIT